MNPHLRLWLHEKVFTRLDQHSTRRSLAGVLVLTLVIVVGGPILLKAQTTGTALNTIDPTINTTTNTTTNTTLNTTTSSTTVCGNGVCDANETMALCPIDCPTTTAPPPTTSTITNTTTTNTPTSSVFQDPPKLDQIQKQIILHAKTVGPIESLYFRIIDSAGLERNAPAGIPNGFGGWDRVIPMLPPGIYKVTAIAQEQATLARRESTTSAFEVTTAIAPTTVPAPTGTTQNTATSTPATTVIPPPIMVAPIEPAKPPVEPLPPIQPIPNNTALIPTTSTSVTTVPPRPEETEPKTLLPKLEIKPVLPTVERSTTSTVTPPNVLAPKIEAAKPINTTAPVPNEAERSTVQTTATSTTTEPPVAPTPPENTITDKPAIPQECLDAGIASWRCDEWLAVKHGDPKCFQAGVLTQEGCKTYLQGLGQIVQPADLSGYIPAVQLETTRQEAIRVYDQPMTALQVPDVIKEALPIVIQPQESIVIVAPAAPTGGTREASVGLLIIDSDSDGLPDDLEARLGTNPRNPDTDGDGHGDGTEVKGNYNPNGPGKLDENLAPIDQALLAKRPIEEPRGLTDKLDPTLTVERATTITEEISPAQSASTTAPKASTPSIRLTGRATPNTVVTLYIYSYLPIVVTTTTDASGNWSYDFTSRLADGSHEVYVAVNDNTGKVTQTSAPLNFFVREAQAATEADFLRGDVNVTAPTELDLRKYLTGGIALILVAGLLVIAIIRQNKKGAETPLPPRS